MRRKKIFYMFSRAAAATTAAVCAAVMTAVGYYSSALPDKYTSAYGCELAVNSLLPITATHTAADRQAYSAAENADEEVSLKLFGSVPIKDVKEETVERPMLAVSGQAFGIRLVTDGVMIIEMKKIDGSCPAQEAGLKVGDVIETINGERVLTNRRVGEIIKASEGEDCTVGFRRGGIKRQCTVTPILSDGSYKAGMWVRDSSAGIGTMTFVDPDTLVFAGLGHAICDSDTREPLPLSQGTVSTVTIESLKKSEKGSPGQLVGEFGGSRTGELTLNCDSGVYGVLNELSDEYVMYPLGFSQEVHEGAAYIISQIDDGEPKRYEISIEKVSATDSDKDMVIKVTDEELISKTGGIVQGMSGSPIIQDGRLIGAVTHVFVDDPTGGYAIFAETMYRCAAQTADQTDLAG